MDLLSVFQEEAEHRVLGAGDVIFANGDPGDAMYVIIDGTVELLGDDGSVFATLGTGEMFGELALIDDEPRSLAAVAKTETTLAAVDERQFLFLVNQTPMFALEVMRIMAERLR